MKKSNAFIAATLAFCLFSCSKNNDTDQSTDFSQLQSQTLNDFVSKVGSPVYASFKVKATALNAAIKVLVATPNTTNQAAARDAWRETRIVWEQSEGFLIGPVEDDNYDPYMDTWPTDYNQMNALLNSNTPLTVQYIESETDDAQLTLRGFHPLEYLLWGTDGNRNPATYTQREKEYMTALAEDIFNNVTKLENSWTTGFSNEIINAGKSGSGSRYTSQKDALEAIVNGLIDICNEVGDSKMKEPFIPAPDSTITESPYSHNSIADFKNNITGAYNVYLCSYNGTTGTSISSLVSTNNKSLDNELKADFSAVITSFDAFNSAKITFESALYKQPSLVQNTLDKIETLKTALNNKLIPYVQQYVKN